MNMHCKSAEAPSRVRDLLSFKEVVVLANVPESRVRKDIETGVLSRPHVVRLADARLCFDWFHVFVVAAVYCNEHLNGKLRKIAIERVESIAQSSDGFDFWKAPYRHAYNHVGVASCGVKVDLDRFVSLDLNGVSHHVGPRVGVYSGGLARIEEKNDILGGEAVFKGTRLPVAHIGKMYEAGEKLENILEDYPYLNEDDIRFAALYYKAHPPTGRPRSGGDSYHGCSSIG